MIQKMGIANTPLEALLKKCTLTFLLAILNFQIFKITFWNFPLSECVLSNFNKLSRLSRSVKLIRLFAYPFFENFLTSSPLLRNLAKLNTTSTPKLRLKLIQVTDLLFLKKLSHLTPAIEILAKLNTTSTLQLRLNSIQVYVFPFFKKFQPADPAIEISTKLNSTQPLSRIVSLIEVSLFLLPNRSTQPPIAVQKHNNK